MAGGLEGPAPDERPQPEGRRNEQGIRIDPEVEATHEPHRTVISALVKHEPGVLAKVSGLFSRRQFNIENLSVGPTKNDDHARITMVVEEPDPGIDQIEKQLAKLLPVVSVTDLGNDAVERELALIKVDGDEPDKVQAVTEMHGGRIAEVTRDTITVEVTGHQDEVAAAVETFERFGVREVVRTGTAALACGPADTARGSTTGKQTPDALAADDD